MQFDGYRFAPPVLRVFLGENQANAEDREKMRLRSLSFRIYAVAVIAAISAALLSALVLATISPIKFSPEETGSLDMIFSSFLIFGWFCLLANFLIGIPLFLAAAKLGFVRWWAVGLLSLFASGILEVVVRRLPYWEIRDFEVFFPLALLCACVFMLGWKISNTREST